MSSKTQQVLDLARAKGLLRPRDLTEHGLSREYLRRLEARGLLVRTARGLYVLPDAEITERHMLAEACKRVPQGVICLLSALQFHNLTTQAPFEVWMALGPTARYPRVESPPLRIIRYSGRSLTEGVEHHIVEGVPVRAYNSAKTVADCFKYRTKIGLDVALEALREAWRERRASMDELWRYAKIDRVANVMRPYLESLQALT
jgi:predicted transcriptional regulator of viral defense system